MAWILIISGLILTLVAAVVRFTLDRRWSKPSRVDHQDPGVRPASVGDYAYPSTPYSRTGEVEDVEDLREYILGVMEEVEEKSFQLEKMFQRLKQREQEDYRRCLERKREEIREKLAARSAAGSNRNQLRTEGYRSLEEIRLLEKKKRLTERRNYRNGLRSRVAPAVTGHPRAGEIFELHERGLSAAEIAGDLNLGVREVELVLKISSWGEGRFVQKR